MNVKEPQDNLIFPYVRQMIRMLEAGPVTTINVATSKEVQFFGLQGVVADFFTFLLGVLKWVRTRNLFWIILN